MKYLLKNSDIIDIIEKVDNNIRLDFDDGVRLFNTNDLISLGYAANLVRTRINGNKTYYIVNRHINYSNICKNQCKFCAFSKSENEAGSYVMTLDEILNKAKEAKNDIDYTELHIVGGLHPSYPFEYYTDMLKMLKKSLPDVHIQAFTAVEIYHFAEISGKGINEVLLELKDAGLGSLPGGGAEIFDPDIRNKLCPEKIDANTWLKVIKTAHNLGIHTNASMLYGHLETTKSKVDHLLRLRDLQDETSGFLAFISLAYHSAGTKLQTPGKSEATSGIDDLKMIAVARLMLDNFKHIKVFWIMVGLKLAQIALSFGADDFDGTVVEEKITHSAGAKTPEALSINDIVRIISETGTVPVERDTLYNLVKR